MAMKKKATKKRGKKAAGKKTAAKKGRKKASKRGRKKASRGKKSAVKKKAGKRKKAKSGTKKPAKRKKAAKKKAAAEEGGVTEVTPASQKPKPFSQTPTTSNPAGNKLIKDFLNNKQVKFETIKHSPAFTAQQIAASAHIPGKNVAKTVIVKIDGKLAMVVEPAHMKVNLDALKRQLNAQRVELASEAEFRSRFPDCELGAMPPFGSLYNMDVYVSDNLSHDEFITFNAATHSELIKMTYRDYYNLARPKVVYA